MHSFLWLLALRSVARLLAPRLPRWSPAVRAKLKAMVPANGVLAHQLRMRIMIGGAAGWQDVDPCDRSPIPCRLLYTADTRHDADFWQPRFEAIDIVALGGDHDHLLDGDSPRLLLEYHAQRAEERVREAVPA